MKKILAPLVALAFGLGAISAFAADAPAKEENAATKADKKPAPKKAKRTAKKRSAAKAKKAQAPAADAASK